MLRPALARRLAQNPRRTSSHLVLAWLRLTALLLAGLLIAWTLLGGAARAEESVRLLASAEDPEVTGSIASSTGAAPALPERTLGGFYGRVEEGAILVRASAPTRCLPGDLKEVVADVAAKFGPVSVESTHRPRAANRARGGAPRSLHIACRAIDFRVQARARAVLAYLRERPEVGGVKVYRNGIIHIDNGERRHW